MKTIENLALLCAAAAIVWGGSIGYGLYQNREKAAWPAPKPPERQERPVYITPETVAAAAQEEALAIASADTATPAKPTRRATDSYILNRANDYGNGAGVPLAPQTQDVRHRFGADGRYAIPQPSQRTIDHR